MLKIVHLEPYFPTGELTVQPVLLWANGQPCYEDITKTASVGRDFFKTITPVPGHSFVYVLAVSAWERYGENRNGDGFPEFPYKEDHSPPGIMPADVLTQHYKSFEKYGKNYRHHQNSDPKKAIGNVVKAFWNPAMHRVELLVDLENDKAPDLAERMGAGEFPPVSMGTKVPYDVCSVCLNRAPTRAQYCNHLKFQMREIVDGKKVAALNPRPRFFDISWVFRGADPNAVMMKKVANELPYELISGLEAGEYLDEMSSNKLAAHKLAVIDKIVQGLPIDAKTEGIDPNELETLRQMRDIILEAGSRAPVIPDDTLDILSGFPLKNVLSTSAASGMTLSTPEFMKLLTHKTDPTIRPTEEELDKSVLMQRPITELFEDNPQLLKQIENAGTFDVDASDVDMDVATLLKPYMEKRSGISEYLKRQLVPEKYRTEAPYTTPFTVSDPATGIQYGTTRGAAVRAHDEIAKRNLYKVLGGSALLGGAYGLIGRGLTARGLGKLKPLAALTLGGLGLSQWPDMGPHYMTDQGVPVPTMTEIVPTNKYAAAGSLALPLMGTLGAMTAMGHDYMSRLDRGIPVGHPALPTSRRALDKLEGAVHEHPIISTVIGTLLLRRLGGTRVAEGLKKHVAGPLGRGAGEVQRRASDALKAFAGGQQKISSWLGPEIISKPSDTVLLPIVNIDKIAERIGEIIVEG
jgi:hypothetical protein